MTAVPILVPDLDAPGAPVRVGEWLAREGETVVEGDRLVELIFGEIVADLPAPATGTLVQPYHGARSLRAGEALGCIVPERRS